MKRYFVTLTFYHNKNKKQAADCLRKLNRVLANYNNRHKTKSAYVAIIDDYSVSKKKKTKTHIHLILLAENYKIVKHIKKYWHKTHGHVYFSKITKEKNYNGKKGFLGIVEYISRHNHDKLYCFNREIAIPLTRTINLIHALETRRPPEREENIKLEEYSIVCT